MAAVFAERNAPAKDQPQGAAPPPYRLPWTAAGSCCVAAPPIICRLSTTTVTTTINLTLDNCPLLPTTSSLTRLSSTSSRSLLLARASVALGYFTPYRTPQNRYASSFTFIAASATVAIAAVGASQVRGRQDTITVRAGASQLPARLISETTRLTPFPSLSFLLP
jgi:hypothetical protein